MLTVWLVLGVLAPVSLRLAWIGGDAHGHAAIRRRLRDPRNAYLRHFQ